MKLNLSYKNIAILTMIALMLFMLFREYNPPSSSAAVDYSDFLKMVESESVIQVMIQGENISGLTAQGSFHIFAPKDPKLIKLLKSKGVKISAEPQEAIHGSK